jgi:peptidyl-prolyl cis-trans isomerase SurA
MYPRLFIPLILALVTIPLFAQESKEDVLMTISDRKITLAEFERIYKKNNSNTAIEQQSVNDYLELFINFKLKVIEAEELGTDTTEAFLKEYNGYVKQLAKPYLVDKEETERLLKVAYERAQSDIHVSHILIRCDEDAAPADTALAWARAFEIRQRILNGEDFGEVAKETSDDPSAKNNAGDLGFFTVFRMVYPFESGAYNTRPGEISTPVRTRFGYHIIQVHEKQPARGSVRVAHIMVLTPQTMDDSQLEEAQKKIFQYYDSLQSGLEFEDIARKYSEDRGSAARGGELAMFGTGRMVPEFEKAAFALVNPGDISEPVKTSFGWHIIKLLEHKGIADYETMKPELQELVNKSDRAGVPKQAMLEKIKKNYHFTEYPANLKPFYGLVDSSYFNREWSASAASHLNEALFTLDNNKYTQKQFAGFLEKEQGNRPVNIQVLVNRKYEQFVNNSLLDYEEKQLPGKYPEYRYLLQEYHDGILLFDLTDKMVWSKAIKDTVGLEEFYKKHKNEYIWNDRMEAVIYTCRDKDVAALARNILTREKDITPDVLAETVRSEVNDSACISYTQGKYEAGDNKFTDGMNWKEEVSGVFNKEGKAVFVVNKGILKPEPKSLDETRGLVTADYQNYLEMKWIEELRKKYPVQVNKELLSKIE